MPESVLNVVSPRADELNALSPKSCVSDDSKNKLEVTERNTFLEVDNKGSKTISIFRCYTSPVYRRLFSYGDSEDANGEPYQAELPSLEEMTKDMSFTDDDDEDDENDSNSGVSRKASRSDNNVEKLTSLSSIKKNSSRKLRQDSRDISRARQFTADLEPFGKFEKFDIEPLNTGGRKHSMMAPAPLDPAAFVGGPDIQIHRRSSKDSEGFHSACSPSVGNKSRQNELTPSLDLKSNNKDGAAAPAASPKKVLVKEEHGGIPEHLCTTIMVRNIPNKYSQRMLHEVFVQYGFEGTFDFLYVPADFFHRLNLGYCFVNFKQPHYAQQFAKIFQDYHLPAFKSKKKIQISLANTQGFTPNVMKLEHTALCSQYVSPEFHPICIDPETNEERPFLSFFPGYKPPPKSRIEDPHYWLDHDAKWEKQWQGDSMYPPVYLKETDRTNNTKAGPAFSPNSDRNRPAGNNNILNPRANSGGRRPQHNNNNNGMGQGGHNNRPNSAPSQHQQHQQHRGGSHGSAHGRQQYQHHHQQHQQQQHW